MMKTKLKTFLLSLSALVLFGLRGNACGGGYSYEGGMANLFYMAKVLDTDVTGVDAVGESVDFWHKYLNGALDKEVLKEAIENGTYKDFNDVAKSDNALAKILSKRSDYKALAYLRINQKLHELKNWGSSWEYEKPNKSEYNKLLKELGGVSSNGKLLERFQYLHIRILFALDRYEDVINNWNENANNWNDEALKRRAKGYLAGAYYHGQRYAEALEIYDSMGDQRSISRCVSKLLDPNELEKYYEVKPNSVVLLYVMQDYANYIYHAKYYDSDQGEIWPQVRRDYTKMMALANRVLKEKKADNLFPWQAFVGFLHYANHEDEAAYQAYLEAEKMNGTADQKKLVRYLKLLASFGAESRPADFVNYVVGEMKVMRQEADIPANELNTVVSPIPATYGLVLPEKLVNYARQCQNKQAELLVYALFGSVEVGGTYVFYDKEKDHKMTTDEVVTFYDKLVKPDKKDELSWALTSMVSPDEAKYLVELIGTKYLREGNYDKAIAWLKQVDNKVLKHQSIATYLNQRKMPKTPFTREDYRILWDEEFEGGRNVKLEFATHMRDNTKALKKLKGDAYANLAYEMAAELYNASYAGDLWAISEYGWSGSDNHYNNLCNLAADLLREAVKTTDNYDILRKCYIALATIAVSNNDKVQYVWKTCSYVFHLTNEDKAAYKWLHDNLATDDKFRARCDFLKSYII